MILLLLAGAPSGACGGLIRNGLLGRVGISSQCRIKGARSHHQHVIKRHLGSAPLLERGITGWYCRAQNQDDLVDK